MKRIIIAYDGSHAADVAINDLLHAGLPAELDVTVMSVADVYLPATSQLPEAAVPEILVIKKARDKAQQEVEAHRGLAERACARLRTMFPKWRCTPHAVGGLTGLGDCEKSNGVEDRSGCSRRAKPFATGADVHRQRLAQGGCRSAVRGPDWT